MRSLKNRSSSYMKKDCSNSQKSVSSVDPIFDENRRTAKLTGITRPARTKNTVVVRKTLLY